MRPDDIDPNWHQTFIRLTRDFGRIFPAPQDITFSDAAAVIAECELSWHNHGHCENQYNEDDPRFRVWAEHTLVIYERIKSLSEPIEGKCKVIDLGPRREAAKHKVNWECEETYV